MLRTWPVHEADQIVSLLTREQGKLRGVAKSAARSRRRFGGALEPMTYVRASYATRPRQELVRLDSFEILRSPLSDPVDYTPRRRASLFYAEVLEEMLPDHDPQDAIFRLLLAVLGADALRPHLDAGHLLCSLDDPPDGLDARPCPLHRVQHRLRQRSRLVGAAAGRAALPGTPGVRQPGARARVAAARRAHLPRPGGQLCGGELAAQPARRICAASPSRTSSGISRPGSAPRWRWRALVDRTYSFP